MLPVDGLLADVQLGGDLLPRPTLGSSVFDLQRFELLDQPTQRGDRSKSNFWVSAARLTRDLRCLSHPVNIR